VTLWPAGRAAARHHSAVLTCPPSGGAHGRPVKACAALERHEDALKPVGSDVACSEIYGGPAEARVTGTIGERRINATFNRSNGCEIVRWDKLAPLLEISAGRAGPR
jgi:hypothetical protein